MAIALLAVSTILYIISGFLLYGQRRAIMVQGLIASWEYRDRDVSLDYFYQLDHKVTYKQIVEEIGWPNGCRGSGIVLPYWQIDRDLFAVMFFSLDESGEWDELMDLQICDHDRTLETIDVWHADDKAICPFGLFDTRGGGISGKIPVCPNTFKKF